MTTQGHDDVRLDFFQILLQLHHTLKVMQHVAFLEEPLKVIPRWLDMA